MCPENLIQENITEQQSEAGKLLAELEAAHQARVSKQMLDQLKNRQVEVQNIAEENSLAIEEQHLAESNLLEHAFVENHSTEQNDNAYALLLEQMRHIYSAGSGCSSWSSKDKCYGTPPDYYDDCSCTTWHDCVSYDHACNNYPCNVQEQINRIEQMVREIYATNQQLYSCIVDYYQKFIYCKPEC